MERKLGWVRSWVRGGGERGLVSTGAGRLLELVRGRGTAGRQASERPTPASAPGSVALSLKS